MVKVMVRGEVGRIKHQIHARVMLAIRKACWATGQYKPFADSGVCNIDIPLEVYTEAERTQSGYGPAYHFWDAAKKRWWKARGAGVPVEEYEAAAANLIGWLEKAMPIWLAQRTPYFSFEKWNKTVKRGEK